MPKLYFQVLYLDELCFDCVNATLSKATATLLLRHIFNRFLTLSIILHPKYTPSTKRCDIHHWNDRKAWQYSDDL